MSIVKQLSSQVGDRTQEANRTVAEQCVDNPSLLAEVAEALAGKDTVLLGDCCEVITKVAERRPEIVLPYIDLLVPLLSHKATRVRWEAMHAIALVAELVPDKISAILPRLAEIIGNDSSTIVRDYAVDALGNFSKANEDAALLAYPVIKEALANWEGKHLGRALAALSNVVKNASSLATDVIQIAYDFADHSKPTVRKAAKALLKVLKQ